MVYGQNVMSEGTVRKWCWIFKEGRKYVHDKEQDARTSAVSADLDQSVDQTPVKTFHTLFSMKSSQLG
jgi:hypothetical protein